MPQFLLTTQKDSDQKTSFKERLQSLISKSKELRALVGYFYPRAANMYRMFRVTPTLLYTIGKFQLGCEYEITSVHYGQAGNLNLHGLANTNLHWVTNHRVQLMTKYNF